MVLSGLRFRVDASKIEVLSSPNDFYERLLHLFLYARRRACISTLYIGTGPRTTAVMKNLSTAAKTQGNALKVDILMDKARGSRMDDAKKMSSLSQCHRLLLEDTNNVHVALFHNPLLSWWLYRILPARVNEMLGVMHLKAFIADDVAIVSGANLSDTYLTNRQDRYIVVKSAEFANAVHRIVNAIQSVSYTLQKDLSMTWESSVVNPLVDANAYKPAFAETMKKAFQELKGKYEMVDEEKGRKTFAYEDDLQKLFHSLTPIDTSQQAKVGNEDTQDAAEACEIEVYLQAGFASPSINDEVGMLDMLFKVANQAARSVVVASGYLNFPTFLLTAIGKFWLHSTSHIKAPCSSQDAPLKILTAAPDANSFFLSKGPSYYIPAAYACTAEQCLKQIFSSTKGVDNDLKDGCSPIVWTPTSSTIESGTLYEYSRPDWTFHSKGIWIYADENTSDKKLPCVTVIGSSNYGERAVHRDLEMSCLIKTKNKRIRQQLQNEVDVILKSCVTVSRHELQSRCTTWLKWFVLCFGKWFL